MSKFHSTVSRRDFMKGLGLAGAGLGAAAAAAPVFHDIDEVMSAPSASQPRPWWVKEREFHHPTTEVDWDNKTRPDPTVTGQQITAWAHYYGDQRAYAADALGAQKVAEREAANAPGYTYRSRALKSSRVIGGNLVKTWAGPDLSTITTRRINSTPEERGEPRWTGTQEEGALILRAFMRLAGSALVGYAEIDQRFRDKLICTNKKHTPGKKFVFENVELGYETDEKFVVPTKNPLYEIVEWELMNNELSRGARAFGSRFNGSDPFGSQIYASTWNFLRYLGYQMLGDGGDSNFPTVEGAGANLTGIAESARSCSFTLSPEYGPVGRIHTYFTDLPVAPTRPIDAGMWKFCFTCGKCAKYCPPQAISHEKEPSWVAPDIQGKPSLVHVGASGGVKVLWNDPVLCRMWRREDGTSCNTCWGECTFTQNTGAIAHDVTKAVVSTTGIFNRFLYNMGEWFGYTTGDDKAEAWWDMSLPILGVDTTRIAFSGGYRK